jgi:hypothetical protein
MGAQESQDRSRLGRCLALRHSAHEDLARSSCERTSGSDRELFVGALVEFDQAGLHGDVVRELGDCDCLLHLWVAAG